MHFLPTIYPYRIRYCTLTVIGLQNRYGILEIDGFKRRDTTGNRKVINIDPHIRLLKDTNIKSKK